MAPVTSSRMGSIGGLGASLCLHLLVVVAVRWAGALPDVGFEIELPSQIEFGVADGANVPSGASDPKTGAPSTGAPPAATAAITQPGPKPVPPKPKPKKTPKKTPAVPDAGVSESGDGGANSKHAQPPALAAYAPQGAQLALRVNLDRVRTSGLATDAESLLQAIPDFRMILDGSGVDPLNDLSRLFLASPNLQRESLVMAGRYIGDEDVPRRAVARLAEARGTTASWRKKGGIAIAPWENADATPRILALLGPSLFAITRVDDLPRILGVAKALAARNQKPGAQPPDATDALLAMDTDEVVAFSVENAKSFVRGDHAHVPERLEISIRFATEETVEVRSKGVFDNSEEAQRALEFWSDTQKRFASHPLVALIGMSEPVRETTLIVTGTELTANTRFTLDQARRLLGFAHDALATHPPASPPPGQ